MRLSLKGQIQGREKKDALNRLHVFPYNLECQLGLLPWNSPFPIVLQSVNLQSHVFFFPLHFPESLCYYPNLFSQESTHQQELGLIDHHRESTGRLHGEGRRHLKLGKKAAQVEPQGLSPEGRWNQSGPVVSLTVDRQRVSWGCTFREHWKGCR